MTQNSTEIPPDPFDNVKVPSISFHDTDSDSSLPVGTKYKGRVTTYVKMTQSIDFQTNKPAYWPLSDEDKAAGKTIGNPKMAAVFSMQVLDGPRAEEIGEIRTVWASKPSELFTKMAEAQRNFGRRIEPGGIIEIELTGFKKNENPKFKPQKLYSVEYQGPAEEEVTDPLGLDEFAGNSAAASI